MKKLFLFFFTCLVLISCNTPLTISGEINKPILDSYSFYHINKSYSLNSVKSSASKHLTLYYHRGSTIKVFSINSPQDIVDIDNLKNCIDDIYKNTFRWDGNLFQGLTIEVYDINSDDIMSKYAGLVYYGQKLIKLRAETLKTFKGMADCLSHEIGHLKANLMGFDDTKNILTQELYRIRLNNQIKLIAPHELTAEDIRHFQGSRETKNVFRTNPDLPHKNPELVQGLRDFYTIFKPANEQLKLFNQGTLYTTDLKLFYSNTNFNYIEIIYKINVWFTWLTFYQKINVYGIFEWRNNNWYLIKAF